MAETAPTLLADARRIHLVGAGGSGMSSLASLLAARGKQLSGSDLSPEAAIRLARQGIPTDVGHHADNLGPADLVITSAAVPPENPELVEARRRGLPILTHAQALGQLMHGQIGVAVAGTHGKTTTTAMLGFILAQAGLDPTVLVGATVLNFNSGARPGQGPHLVVEADEYDRRFLQLRPHLAIITGIEPDHLDSYRDLDEITAAFQSFAALLPPDGHLITSADDPTLRSATSDGGRRPGAGGRSPTPGARPSTPADSGRRPPAASRPSVPRRTTYGLAPDADWHLHTFQPQPGGGCTFAITTPARTLRVALQLTGQHNAANATAALAAATALGAPPAEAARALADFRGAERRFQTVAHPNGIWIVDDYAHHPTAVRATLEAARQVHAGRLWAVFQPHTTNRVAALLDAFATAFEPADRLTLLPIYSPPGRERGARSVTSADVARVIERPPVSLAESLEAAEQELARDALPGDLILVMGAGDVTRLSQGLAGRISERGAL